MKNQKIPLFKQFKLSSRKSFTSSVESEKFLENAINKLSNPSTFTEKKQLRTNKKALTTRESISNIRLFSKKGSKPLHLSRENSIEKKHEKIYDKNHENIVKIQDKNHENIGKIHDQKYKNILKNEAFFQPKSRHLPSLSIGGVIGESFSMKNSRFFPKKSLCTFRDEYQILGENTMKYPSNISQLKLSVNKSGEAYRKSLNSDAFLIKKLQKSKNLLLK